MPVVTAFEKSDAGEYPQLSVSCQTDREQSSWRRSQPALDLREVVHSVRTGITNYAVYMLDPAGLISSWNAGAQRIKGYTAGEIIGQHYRRFYTEEDRARKLPEEALRAAAEFGKFEVEG